MAELSDEQRLFFERHEIPLSRVLDATGLQRSRYSKIMEEIGYVVAVGVSPCKSFGHTIRTRAGHCVQCKPACLAFEGRYDNPGEVYVAISSDSGLTKVGTGRSASERVRTLNFLGYGGISDWTLHFSHHCEKAGRVEFASQQKIKHFRVSRSYFREGVQVNCQELFSCAAEVAVGAITSVIAVK